MTQNTIHILVHGAIIQPFPFVPSEPEKPKTNPGSTFEIDNFIWQNPLNSVETRSSLWIVALWSPVSGSELHNFIRFYAAV